MWKKKKKKNENEGRRGKKKIESCPSSEHGSIPCKRKKKTQHGKVVDMEVREENERYDEREERREKREKSGVERRREAVIQSNNYQKPWLEPPSPLFPVSAILEGASSLHHSFLLALLLPLIPLLLLLCIFLPDESFLSHPELSPTLVTMMLVWTLLPEKYSILVSLTLILNIAFTIYILHSAMYMGKLEYYICVVYLWKNQVLHT